MAVRTAPVTIGTSATLIAENTARADGPEPGRVGEWATRSYLLKNVTGTATVRVGTPADPEADWWPWDVADGPLEVELEPGEQLYGKASVSQVVHVFSQGR